MANEEIVVRGARSHNLKNIDVTIPRDEFVGRNRLVRSGKSSLAFDTLYAEGETALNLFLHMPVNSWVK